MNKLDNKIIVVTGGNGLLGKSFISHIENEGGTAINADINCKDQLDKNEINLDITSTESIDVKINLIIKHYGRIDGWVNNAYPRTEDWGAKFEDIPFKSWEKNVSWQMNSYFYCMQKVLEIMKNKETGSFINISSIYGTIGPDFDVYDKTNMTMPAAYSAIKGGINSLTKYLASYYGKSNLRVNCVSPGGVLNNQPQSFIDSYEKKVPLGRMATPNDIAPSVVFLLSDQSKYITGHNLIIDGGWTAI
ncbi:MAG: short-chain dehydrogenase [Flavobacteriales bacterium]|nr:MAG: short-chain dehydrogenase [Flavobacteriales bacterium]